MDQRDTDAALEDMPRQASRNLYWRTLGMFAEEIREGYARVRLPIHDGLLNAVGRPVHGGAISSLIDAAAGAAVHSLRPDESETQQVTLDLNVSYLNAALSGGGDLVGESRVVKRGRNILFTSVEVHDQRGRHIATGRCTYMLLGGRKRDTASGRSAGA